MIFKNINYIEPPSIESLKRKWPSDSLNSAAAWPKVGLLARTFPFPRASGQKFSYLHEFTQIYFSKSPSNKNVLNEFSKIFVRWKVTSAVLLNR